MKILQSHFWASEANDRKYPVEYTPSLFIVNMLYLKDKFLIIGLQLLEEMLDNGFPLATEPNILRELINPPSLVRQVVNTVTGGSQ